MRERFAGFADGRRRRVAGCLLALVWGAQSAWTQESVGVAGSANAVPAESSSPPQSVSPQVLPGSVRLPTRVQSVPSARAMPLAVMPKRKSSYTVEVDPTKGWTDTGIPLRAGDRLTLTATGSLEIGQRGRATADGVERGWLDLLRSLPLEDGRVGALIGRVGDAAAAVPFPIGASAELPVRQAGNLFVRANLPSDIPASGAWKLRVSFARTAQDAMSAAGALPAQPGAIPAEPVSEIAQVLPVASVDALPRRVADQEGTPGDAVNFALVGTEEQVKRAFVRSGWVAVDADTGSAIVNGLMATLQHKAYLAVPMSKLYLFGRPQDMSYARAEAVKVATERHHLRVWRSEVEVEGRPLWVGSATYDNGLERDERNGKMTHSIDPEIDKERDFLRESFDSSGSMSSAAMVLPADSVHEAHTATGGSFHTDGRMLVMALN